MVGGPAPGADNSGWFQNGITAPAWVRTLVTAVLAATLASAAGLWWLSGRRPSKRRVAAGSGTALFGCTDHYVRVITVKSEVAPF